MERLALPTLQGAPGLGTPSEASQPAAGGLGPCPSASAHQSLGRLWERGNPERSCCPRGGWLSWQVQWGDRGDEVGHKQASPEEYVGGMLMFPLQRG